MSVLIKGMKVPQNCDACPMLYEYRFCALTDDHASSIEWKMEEKRMPNCPLIELPDNGDTVKDAVVIVRCKDCEFYTADERWCRRLGLCGAFDPDDFCSHAERSVTVCPLHSDDEVTEYCSQCGARMDAPDKPKQISAEFAKLMREGEIQVRWKR